MKSDKKRPGREKSNRDKLNKDKFNKEKVDAEKADVETPDAEKSDKETPDAEKVDKEKADVETPDAEKVDKEKADVEKVDAEKADVEKADAVKADTETPDKERAGKEEHASAEAAVDGHDGNEGEKRVPEGSSVKADNEAEADNTAEADSTAEVDNEAEADSTAETDNSTEADSTAETDSTAEAESTAPAESGEPDDREDDEDDWEKDDGLQDDWEEESEPSKPWVVALVFLGMVFVAGCICVMLWIFTHPDRQEEGNQNVFAGTDSVPGNGDALSPSQTALSGTENNQGDNAADVPGSGETDAPAHASNVNRITTQEGRVIIFRDCDDVVTPKEYVNLRTEPSTAQGDATVGCSLSKGETAHRTGISDEMGWSRVEYNDQVLYVVTSLVSVVTDSQTAE